MPTRAAHTGSQTTAFMALSVEGFDAVNGVTEGDLLFSRSLMGSFPVSGQLVQCVGSLRTWEQIKPWNEPRNTIHPAIHVQSVQRQQGSDDNQVMGSVPNRQSPHAMVALHDSPGVKITTISADSCSNQHPHSSIFAWQPWVTCHFSHPPFF